MAAISGARTSRIRRIERDAIDKWGGLYLPPRDVVFSDMLRAIGFVVMSTESAAIQPYAFKFFVRYRHHLFHADPAIVTLKPRNHMAVVCGSAFVDSDRPLPTPLDAAPRAWKVTEILYLGRAADRE